MLQEEIEKYIKLIVRNYKLLAINAVLKDYRTMPQYNGPTKFGEKSLGMRPGVQEPE